MKILGLLFLLFTFCSFAQEGSSVGGSPYGGSGGSGSGEEVMTVIATDHACYKPCGQKGFSKACKECLQKHAVVPKAVYPGPSLEKPKNEKDPMDYRTSSGESDKEEVECNATSHPYVIDCIDGEYSNNDEISRWVMAREEQIKRMEEQSKNGVDNTMVRPSIYPKAIMRSKDWKCHRTDNLQVVECSDGTYVKGPSVDQDHRGPGVRDNTYVKPKVIIDPATGKVVKPI